MAIAVTPDVNNAARGSTKRWLVTALDGDTGEFLFNHGFVDQRGNPVAPEDVFFRPDQPAFFAGQYHVSTISTTQIGVSKEIGGVGTGTAPPGLMLTVKRPHSAIMT